MINLKTFLKLAENTLKRHNEGNYSYQSADCSFCIEYVNNHFGCGECPMVVNSMKWCATMKTYKTDLRPEYWVRVIYRVKLLIQLSSTSKPEMSRKDLSEMLWDIDNELAEN